MTVGALLSNFLDPFGLSPTNIAYLGIILTIFGALSAVIVSIIVDRTSEYRLIHLTLMSFTAIISFIVIFSLHTEIKWFFILCVLAFGLVGVGIRPVSLSYGVELTFPMPPALSNGLMAFAGNLISFLLSFSISFMTETKLTDDQFSE